MRIVYNVTCYRNYVLHVQQKKCYYYFVQLQEWVNQKVQWEKMVSFDEQVKAS